MITYERFPSPHYIFNAATSPPPVAGWESGTEYNIGDEIVIDGIHFRCVRDHTAGDAPSTRSPMVGLNKTTWVVTGFDNNADNTYFSRLRYAEGVVVTYDDKSYKRTGYNLSGGQTPSDNSLYWEVVNN